MSWPSRNPTCLGFPVLGNKKRKGREKKEKNKKYEHFQI
jgi:hypothetical protein